MVQDDGIPKGMVSIGVMETAAAVWLPGVLARYSRQYPEVDVQLVIQPTDQLVLMERIIFVRW